VVDKTKRARKGQKSSATAAPKLPSDIGVAVSVADQIRGATRPKHEPALDAEPKLEAAPNPVAASVPPPNWKRREAERVERLEQLRLAQAIERRVERELQIAEQAEQRKVQERAREREAAERREQRRLVEQIERQRRRELQLAVQVQIE
jgi:hypothetical protein